MEPEATELDVVLDRADTILAREAETASTDQSETEYSVVMARLRDAAERERAATREQTLLMAYARTHLMPPASYQALADAVGMSYSGVRARLTPEVLAAVRNARQ